MTGHEFCSNVWSRFTEWKTWRDEQRGDGLFILDRLRDLDRANLRDLSRCQPPNDDDLSPCRSTVKSW